MGDEPYAALLPWVVFAMVGRWNGQGALWAAIAAVVTAVTLLATRRHAPVGRHNVIVAGAVVWFAGLAIVNQVNGPIEDWLVRNGRAASALGFVVIAFASLALHPATEYYTRMHTRPNQWDTAPFRRLNTHLTILWGLAFALICLSHLAATIVNRPEGYTTLNWVIPVALAVIAAHRTRSWWDDYTEAEADHSARDPLWDLTVDLSSTAPSPRDF